MSSHLNDWPNEVALVAKPWRGGLSDYMAMALEEKFPGRVSRLYTYPVTADEKRLYRKNKAAWRGELIDRIQSLKAELVLFLNLLPEFSGLPNKPGYVVWLTDDPRRVLNDLRPFSRIFISDPGYADAVGSSVVRDRFSGVLPFACQPSVHREVIHSPSAEGFCFIANYDAKRDKVLRYVFRHGKSVRVYGNYFLQRPLFWRYPRSFKPSIGYGAMGDVYSMHLASINIHADVVRGGTNMRTYECAAYGIPQIVEYMPGLEELFDLDKELYVYRCDQELVSQMSRIEHERIQAHKRAEKAHSRVLSEHTYMHRVETILSSL